MKDWMAIHTFLSEDAKAQHLSAKGKVRTEKEWAEYSMSLEKAKCVQEWPVMRSFSSAIGKRKPLGGVLKMIQS